MTLHIFTKPDFAKSIPTSTNFPKIPFRNFRAARQQGTSRRVLSRRQNNILNLIREKLTNREIGDELGYSESTIRQETMRIYQVLHVNNRREAAAFKFIED